MTWNRECDRIIAEKREGLTTHAFTVKAGFTEYGTKLHDLPVRREWQRYQSIPHYNADIAACIRAAEGWTRQRRGRRVSVSMERGVNDDGSIVIYHRASVAQNLTAKSQKLANPGMDPESVDIDAEHLHEALYEAVKNA